MCNWVSLDIGSYETITTKVMNLSITHKSFYVPLCDPSLLTLTALFPKQTLTC